MASSLDKDKVREIIDSFYKAAELSGWKGEVTEGTAAEFGKMIEEVKKCSGGLSWVPRPPGGKASIAWLISSLGKASRRQIKDEISVTCLRGVIYRMGRNLETAAIFGY